MEETIAKEVELNVINLNGENNHKLLAKDMKGTWQYKYTSTTRTILRTVWLLDFIAILFTRLDQNRDAALSHCAREAYNEGLGIHHPWVVRQAAKVAMYAVPGREALLSSTHLKYEHCQAIVSGANVIREHLWALYREKGFDTLP